MPSFTVQDTRTCDAPRVPLAHAEAPVLRHLDAPSAAASAHSAAHTGVPGWCPPPHLESARNLNCRIIAIAEEADPTLDREAILKRSPTTCTGVMPVRLGFADRVAAVILLVNTAFHRQYALFRGAQEAMRASVPADVTLLPPHVAESLFVPEDMADFDFMLQWRELRDDVTSTLRKHYEAATRAFAAAAGTPEHQEASLAAQRTSPEVLVQALSGMTIFDPVKWGAFATPYDEDELLRAQAEVVALANANPGTEMPNIAVSPPLPTTAAAALHADPSTSTVRGGGMTTNLATPFDNGSFIPSPGASSRPGSPSEGGGSFGSAPVDYCAPASADTTPTPTPNPPHSGGGSCYAAVVKPGHHQEDEDAAASSDNDNDNDNEVVTQGGFAAAAAAAGCWTVAPFVLPGTAPSASSATAAAVNSIERPERALSLADCLDADAIAERQQAAAGYRTEVLRVCGLVGGCHV